MGLQRLRIPLRGAGSWGAPAWERKPAAPSPGCPALPTCQCPWPCPWAAPVRGSLSCAQPGMQQEPPSKSPTGCGPHPEAPPGEPCARRATQGPEEGRPAQPLLCGALCGPGSHSARRLPGRAQRGEQSRGQFLRRRAGSPRRGQRFLSSGVLGPQSAPARSVRSRQVSEPREGDSPLSPGFRPPRPHPAPTPGRRGASQRPTIPMATAGCHGCETGRPRSAHSQPHGAPGGRASGHTGLEEGWGGGAGDVGRRGGGRRSQGGGRGAWLWGAGGGGNGWSRGRGGWPGLQVTPPGSLHQPISVFHLGGRWRLGTSLTHSQIQGQEFPPEARAGLRPKSWDLGLCWHRSPMASLWCPGLIGLPCLRKGKDFWGGGSLPALPCHLVVSWASHCIHWAGSLELPRPLGCWDNQTFPGGRPGLGVAGTWG